MEFVRFDSDTDSDVDDVSSVENGDDVGVEIVPKSDQEESDNDTDETTCDLPAAIETVEATAEVDPMVSSSSSTGDGGSGQPLDQREDDDDDDQAVSEVRFLLLTARHTVSDYYINVKSKGILSHEDE